MHERIASECAMAAAEIIMHKVIREGQGRPFKEVFMEVYAVCKGGIADYLDEYQKMQHRLKPLEKP